MKVTVTIAADISGQDKPEYQLFLSDEQLGIILNAVSNPDWADIAPYEKEPLRAIKRALRKVHGTKPSADDV